MPTERSYETVLRNRAEFQMDSWKSHPRFRSSVMVCLIASPQAAIVVWRASKELVSISFLCSASWSNILSVGSVIFLTQGVKGDGRQVYSNWSCHMVMFLHGFRLCRALTIAGDDVPPHLSLLDYDTVANLLRLSRLSDLLSSGLKGSHLHELSFRVSDLWLPTQRSATPSLPQLRLRLRGLTVKNLAIIGLLSFGFFVSFDMFN